MSTGDRLKEFNAQEAMARFWKARPEPWTEWTNDAYVEGERYQFNQTQERIKDLEWFYNTVCGYVIPGEVDTGDSIKLLLKDFRKNKVNLDSSLSMLEEMESLLRDSVDGIGGQWIFNRGELLGKLVQWKKDQGL